MKQVFEMIPPGNGVNWFFGALTLLFLGILILFLFMAWSAHHIRFELDAGTLRLRGDLWSRSIATSNLRLSEAQIVDAGSHPFYRPKRKTSGSALPGYYTGWFKLANGEKALLYLSDRRRAVYIPTTEGYSLLLSPQNPDAFLAALRRG
jgi:hypothetical protein